MASVELGKPHGSGGLPIDRQWSKVRPPDRPLWIVLRREYSLRGKEHISAEHHTTTECREEAQVMLEELRRLYPHAIFEMAEC
jgi:hypothetical protein